MTKKKLVYASGVFYTILCVFSIVTGLMYALGCRKLNPVELSDHFMKKLSSPAAMKRFTVSMGWTTVVVGIVQGIMAFSLFRSKKQFPVGFTVFSLFSVGFKIIRKFSLFALSKTIAYTGILISLLLHDRSDC